MEFYCNYIWEKGLREKNEDSLCIRQIKKDGKNYLLAVICDGIGGLEEGENASSFVVNSMLEHFNKLIRSKRTLSAGKVWNSVKRQLFRCHKVIQRYGKERGIQLGTTMSMIMICGKKGYLFHVGDSALFIGKRKLRRKTPLHHTETGALTQAVGIGKGPMVYYRSFIVRKGMVVLLASDGFYKRSEDFIGRKEWIKRIGYEEKQIREQLVTVKNTVMKSGEKDNISAICIKVR